MAYKKRKTRRERKRVEDVLESMDIPLSALLDLPRLEVVSNKNMIIENHKGVLKYEDDEICVNCGKLTIRIEGQGLTLKAMSDAELAISGLFTSISYSS